MSWAHLDEALSKYPVELKAMGVPEDCILTIATCIKKELFQLNSDVLIKGFLHHYPDSNSIFTEVESNLKLLSMYNDAKVQDKAIEHGLSLATNYLYFVYAQDSFLKPSLGAPQKLA